MSLTAVVRTPKVAPEAPSRAPRARLEPVTAPRARRKPKLAYALVALGGAMAIGAAQIGLSLAITQDSFTLASLSSQQGDLNLRTQALATGASALGMVVAGAPSYLRLSDGAVIGAGTGAGWASTVDPNGAGAVSNSLLQAPTNDATDGPVTEDATTPTEQLPPAITDGLPSPTTH